MKVKKMMEKLKYIVLAFTILLLFTGCNSNNKDIENGTATKQSQTQENSTNGEMVKQKTEQVYASVEGKKISQEEMDYECFRVKVQNTLANTAEQNSCPSEKTLISQIVELKAVDYLAKESSVSATREEVQQRLDKFKNEVASNAVFQDMIASFGAEKFWKFEEQRYYTIINAEKVKEKLFEEQKQKQSYLDDRALKLSAQQSFDDLIVEAVGQVDTTIFYH
ncbi:hypothetical protein M670_04753 [Schinkia azotoformans MEV2011]|uniref:Uncharacterized protein n=3 Tax=Schinkia azotoformans TaxID=1454 RepID=A0A072NFW6_SCHAZ|nr:hypothetical protein M670_04753 [Schinkia azotoformans MEV2011]